MANPPPRTEEMAITCGGDEGTSRSDGGSVSDIISPRNVLAQTADSAAVEPRWSGRRREVARRSCSAGDASAANDREGDAV